MIEDDERPSAEEYDDSPWTREELQALAWERVQHEDWGEYDDLAGEATIGGGSGVATQHVVKGGLGPPPRGAWSIQTFREGGALVTGTTAHSEPGKSVAELVACTATPQVRVSSVERIRAAGGDVIPTRRGPAQPYHVTITGLTLEELDAAFDPSIPPPAG